MKKAKSLIYPLILMGILTFLVNSCEKDESSLNSNTVINSDGKSGTVTDVDGNVYKIVKIGKQWWMAENLKTTKYNDGTSIILTTDDNEWINLNSPSYCWYNNDQTNFGNMYGALYN